MVDSLMIEAVPNSKFFFFSIKTKVQERWYVTHTQINKNNALASYLRQQVKKGSSLYNIFIWIHMKVKKMALGKKLRKYFVLKMLHVHHRHDDCVKKRVQKSVSFSSFLSTRTYTCTWCRLRFLFFVVFAHFCIMYRVLLEPLNCTIFICSCRVFFMHKTVDYFLEKFSLNLSWQIHSYF
jgi:hypothetical protein